ncbi:MAG: hypothetical protein B6D34_01320 [Candidatus Brocadia sp. UTAMX1]|nr:MAG: hypothetical protein B6D34_01320 [Candidatus Brocadia sp. UTAMX1]
MSVHSGAILTIEPGCLVKFDAGKGLLIGNVNDGDATLNAVGTNGKPITFTSNGSPPAAGDWDGIRFYVNTGTNTTMDYCTVEYGGNGGSGDSNIYCENASPTIQHCIIKDSSNYGIHTTGSNAQPSVSCSRIAFNEYGVYAEDSSNPTVNNCYFLLNSEYGVCNTTSAVTINAENNFWGDWDVPKGPGPVGPGSGDKVSYNVDYTPWIDWWEVACGYSFGLSPSDVTNPVGVPHTVTATLRDESDNPVEGTVISFKIVSGPHSGLQGTDTTNSSGTATFTYTGTSTGKDTIDGRYDYFPLQWTVSTSVTKAWEGPTAITLSDFHARAGKGGSVELTWETATEVDNAGFNLYRSRGKGGVYKKINDALIPAMGNATSGAKYSYTDTPPARGKYYYKLEDVDYNGASTMHGPEKVKVMSEKASARKLQRQGRK